MDQDKLHPEDIKAQIRKQCGSLAELARQHAVSESVVQTAVHRLQPTGNRIIAAVLGKPVHVLWPHLFDASGNVRPEARRGRHRDDRQLSAAPRMQKATAA